MFQYLRSILQLSREMSQKIKRGLDAVRFEFFYVRIRRMKEFLGEKHDFIVWKPLQNAKFVSTFSLTPHPFFNKKTLFEYRYQFVKYHETPIDIPTKETLVKQ